MFVLSNALKSISRSLGRNILIGIIVFTIAVAACISLAIKKAASDAETTGLDNMTITASISVDLAKLMEEMTDENSEAQQGGRPDISAMREMLAKYPDLTLEQLLPYAGSANVKSFDYSYTTNLSATEGIEAFTQDGSSTNDETQTDDENMPLGGDRGGMDGGMMIGGGMIFGGNISQGDFAVTGYSSEAAMTEFVNGETQVIDGGSIFDTATADMNCLISEELAFINSLNIGDRITLQNPANESETYTFKICGLYKGIKSESSSMPFFSNSMDPSNAIYISYKSLETLISNSKASAVQVEDTNGNSRSSELGGTLTSSFSFTGVEELENFKEQVYGGGLSEYYAITSNDVFNFEASLIPLKNLSNFANTLLIIILAVGAIVLIVLNIFNIRERKFEVGVLTAIGVKKGTVAIQFVTELLIITLISIVIGSGVGAIASVPVSSELLKSQVTALEETQNNQEQNFGRPGGGAATQGGGPIMIQGGNRLQRGDIFGGNVDYIEEVNASVNLTVLLQLIGIGIALAFISSFAAIIFVLRYEPLKILANRA